MKRNLFVALAIIVSLYANAQTSKTDDTKSKNEIVTAENVEWGWLNASDIS